MNSNQPHHPGEAVIPQEEEVPLTFKEKFRRMGGGGMIISISIHLLLLLVFTLLIFKVIQPPPPPIPDFSAMGGGGGGAGDVTHKVQTMSRKAAQMSDQSKRVAVSSTSDFTLPDPTDSPAAVAPPEVGGSAGHGIGTGSGSGGGNGAGSGGGNGNGYGTGTGNSFSSKFKSTLFFGQALNRRAVFVLDFSKSMEESDRKGILMREFEKSIQAMPDDTEYQVIMFAGYAWLPGDNVDLAADQMSAIIKRDDKTFNWVRPSRNNYDWLAIDGNNKHFLRPVTWEKSSLASSQALVETMKGTKLQMNTSWDIPLEMALNMKPAPEVIYFMTDGITSDGSGEKAVAKITGIAKSTKTEINAISMMESKEMETKAMRELADKTQGGFSIVNEDGTAKTVTQAKSASLPKKAGPDGLGNDLR